MSTPTHAYAAQSAGTPLAAWQMMRRPLRADDVAIDILFCGVCHTDIHQTRNDWGNAVYPMVPGHEIIGRVAEVGPEVTRYQPGDTVGVGVIVDSCGRCEACLAGVEVACENISTQTYNDKDRHDGSPTYGGYSARIVMREKFVLRIPEALDPKRAGPLLCAGITTYSPLRRYNAGPGKEVAVVGLGGLGHMAVKFAKAIGANVSLFTRTPGKEDEAGRLGAGRVVLSTDPQQMAEAARTFDLIIDTVPVAHDLNPYMSTLKRNGTLVIVGQLTPIEPPLQAISLVAGNKAVAGSGAGGLAETQEMLEFCAARGVACDVEMIDIKDINAAYARILKSDVRYRFVIDMASLK